LVRYLGRRSGETFITPTMYAAHGDGIVIFVGTPERKTWWRNFRGGRNLEVLLDGRWVPMFGELVVGADNADRIAPLLASYLRRYPKFARRLPRGAAEAGSAIVVWCRPRTSTVVAPGEQTAPSQTLTNLGRPAMLSFSPHRSA
jgi:F420H(2)-dependent quinone reductase